MRTGVMIEKKEPTLDEQIQACFLEPKTGRYVIQQDGFAYSGLLTIPDNAKRASTTGIVVKVGPECDESLIGKRVVFGSFSGTLIQYKGKPAYRIMSGDELLATVKTNEELELENVSG